MDGDDGLDRVEVNGAGAGDAFTIAPNGARAKFDRTNLVPFTLDIGTRRAARRPRPGRRRHVQRRGRHRGAARAARRRRRRQRHAHRRGGRRHAARRLGQRHASTAAPGLDLLDGQDGDDTLRARDGAADAARCGAGTDSVQTDAPGVDALDGCETVDARGRRPPPPAAAAAGPAPTRRRRRSRSSPAAPTVRIARGRRSARVTVSCPAAELGGCTGTLTLLTRQAGQRSAASARASCSAARATRCEPASGAR